MQNRFTSFELSKKLFENGCRLGTTASEGYIGYDFFWDICMKYSKEMFIKSNIINYSPMIDVVGMLLKNIAQEDIEEIFWRWCKFNPENKKCK